MPATVAPKEVAPGNFSPALEKIAPPDNAVMGTRSPESLRGVPRVQVPPWRDRSCQIKAGAITQEFRSK
jgi:hypothetical protein